MRYATKVTSKGTITIPAPIRKALGIKTGQSIGMRLDEDNRVVMDTGMTIEQLERIRDKVLSKYPDRPKGLSMKAMRDIATKTWLTEKK